MKSPRLSTKDLSDPLNSRKIKEISGHFEDALLNEMKKGLKKKIKKMKAKEMEKKRMSRLLDQAERQVSQRHATVEVLTDDIFIVNDYVKSLTQDLDELKLKEQIAHTAKEVVQDAHQKSQKELQALKDIVKEYLKYHPEDHGKDRYKVLEELKPMIK